MRQTSADQQNSSRSDSRRWGYLSLTCGLMALFLVTQGTQAGVKPTPTPSPMPELISMIISPSSPDLSKHLVSQLLSEPPAKNASTAPVAIKSEVDYQKISLAFDPPIRGVHQISVDGCEGSFRDGIEFFVYPGLLRFYGEGGLDSVKARLPTDVPELRSLSLNLRRNKNTCLKSIVFRDAAGKAIEVGISLPQPEPAEDVIPPAALATGITAAVSVGKSDSSDKEPVKPSLTSVFAGAGLDGFLDQELTPKTDDESWIFRFRSDGTFFVYGKSDVGSDENEAGRFSALGDFKIEETSKSSIKIRLQGERFISPGPWDGWYCGHSCGKRDLSSVPAVADPLVLERLPNGGFVIRNRANPKSRTLPLADLQVRAAIF